MGSFELEDLPELDLKSKKRKKKEVNELAMLNENWQKSERDYDYFELLDRMQVLLQDSGSSSGKSNRLKLPPPSLLKDGTTKTIWANFPQICNKLHRALDHVQTYALAELGTTGSLDGEQALTIKGRFQPKQVENVIKHYISEFVKCNTCGGLDTVLKKENRLHFLYCNLCLSRRTVQAIKQGYVHQIKRKK